MPAQKKKRRPRPRWFEARKFGPDTSDLRMFFWVIFSILILFATWNVLTDDWLVTPELGVLSVLLILLAAGKRVASSHRSGRRSPC